MNIQMNRRAPLRSVVLIAASSWLASVANAQFNDSMEKDFLIAKSKIDAVQNSQDILPEDRVPKIRSTAKQVISPYMDLLNFHKKSLNSLNLHFREQTENFFRLSEQMRMSSGVIGISSSTSENETIASLLQNAAVEHQRIEWELASETIVENDALRQQQEVVDHLKIKSQESQIQTLEQQLNALQESLARTEPLYKQGVIKDEIVEEQKLKIAMAKSQLEVALVRLKEMAAQNELNKVTEIEKRAVRKSQLQRREEVIEKQISELRRRAQDSIEISMMSRNLERLQDLMSKIEQEKQSHQLRILELQVFIDCIEEIATKAIESPAVDDSK